MQTNNWRRQYLKSLLNHPLIPPLLNNFIHGKTNIQANIAWLEEYSSLDTTSPDKRQINKDTLRPIRENQPLTVLELFNSENHILLCGDEGSGKRTFLRTALINLAVKNLAATDLNSSDIFEDFSSKKMNGNWDQIKLLPVYFSMSELISWNTKQTHNKNLISFLNNKFSQEGYSDQISLIEKVIEKDGIQLFIDAISIDPLLTSQVQMALNQILKFAQEYQKSRVLIIANGKKNEWEENEISKEFCIGEIAQLSKNQIQQCLHSMYKFLSKENVIGQKLLLKSEKDLNNQLVQTPKLKSITSNPFLLSLLMILSVFGGYPSPISKEGILEETTRQIIKRWVWKDRPIEEVLNTSTEEIISMISRLAYQRANLTPNRDTELTLGRDDIVSGLIKINKNLHLDKPKFTKEVEICDGIFIESKPGLFSISGSLLEDNLLANHLSKTLSIKKIVQFVLNNPPANQNLINLTAAKYSRLQPQRLKFLIEALLKHKEKQYSWSSYFAGMIMDENIQEELSKSDLVKKVQLSLIKVLESGGLPINKKISLGEMIAKIGDTRFLKDAWYLPADSNFGFQKIPEGDFIMGTREEETKSLIEEFGTGSDWEGQTLGAMLSLEPNIDRLIKEMGLSEDWKELDSKILMKQWYKRETPQHRVWLPTYYIGRYPVTIAQFRAFVLISGLKPEIPEGLVGISNHPISHVTWDDAMRYCDWLTQILKNYFKTPEVIKNLLDNGWKINLPSEAEWEKAARGPASEATTTRRYPWGDEFSPDKANLKETGLGMTSSVGSFPFGASYYGLLDMSGNVWEWTRSMWGEEEYIVNYPYPYIRTDGRERRQENKLNSLRTLRGASFNNYRRYARCAARRSPLPVLPSSIRGFRIVITPNAHGLS
jgi:formylglycine-generating enzyme required for sulfatase activity